MVIFQQIEPFVVNDFNHNGVRIEVYYDKKTKSPTLTFQACEIDPEEHKPDHTGFKGFKFAIFSSPLENHRLDTWKLNNAKKLATLRDTVYEGIANRAGAEWEKLVQFLTKHKSKIVDNAVS